jgi:hypothetical protein
MAAKITKKSLNKPKASDMNFKLFSYFDNKDSKCEGDQQ